MLKIFFLFLCESLFLWASTPVIIEHPQVLEYAQRKLPHEGLLKMTEEGFLYVAVPEEYVFQLIKLLAKDKTIVCPPPYFKKEGVGAHITVATSEEMKDRKESVPYLGQKIDFSILRLEKVDLQQSVLKAKTVYLLSIESPKILEIRRKLGLSEKIRDYNFHITIAVDCS